MQPAEKPENTSRNNRRTVFACLAALAVMGAITAASPLLYSIFCKATGYGGTTQRVERNTDKVLNRVITVRFDANVSPQLAWKFEPDVPTMNVKVGETNLAFFRATNTSDKPLTGQAAFNVTPEVFGSYFKKIECFCFKEQTLQPHQTVEMPVTFFIDPKMVDDESTNQLSTVALSYVFFPVENPAVANTTPPQPEKSGG
ncbi:MAG TPA: cytochrome c oxidase assembly protein [Hyphomicrobium sp.]